MCYIAAPPHMRRVVRLLVEERMQVKLLQVVWNFPETVKQPFNMYYFYWPLYEAMLRGNVARLEGGSSDVPGQ